MSIFRAQELTRNLVLVVSETCILMNMCARARICGKKCIKHQNALLEKVHTTENIQDPPFKIYAVYSLLKSLTNLQSCKSGLEISEHGLDLIRTSGVFAKAGLSYDRHSSIIRDPLELLSEVPKGILTNCSLRWQK